MEDKTLEEISETDSTSESEVAEETIETPEQDPLKTELEKVKSGRTEAEKAAFSLKKNADRVRELGGDPASILDIGQPTDGDDTPVTRAELNELIAKQGSKTALQLAEEITDSTERELVKHYLETRITASGNPHDDLRDARRLVNSIKNEQILEEQNRKSPAKTHSNSSGVDGKSSKPEPELTPEEMLFTKAPFNMSVADIIKSRQRPS